MNDFRPRSAGDCSISESDTEKLIVLPCFEVSQPRKRPVDDLFTWIQCFARYTAAMAKEYPECTPGFMSHLLTEMKAYCEARQPAWQEYDVAFREKMACPIPAAPPPGPIPLGRGGESGSRREHGRGRGAEERGAAAEGEGVAAEAEEVAAEGEGVEQEEEVGEEEERVGEEEQQHNHRLQDQGLY